MKVRNGVKYVNNTATMDDNNGNKYESTTKASVSVYNSSHPKTGDSSMIALYSMTGILSALLIAVLMVLRKKSDDEDRA